MGLRGSGSNKRLKQTFTADLPKRDRILNGFYAYPELLEGLFPLWKTEGYRRVRSLILNTLCL